MAEERKEMQSEQKQTTQVNGSAETKKRRSANFNYGKPDWTGKTSDSYHAGGNRPWNLRLFVCYFSDYPCRTGDRAWIVDRRGRHECPGG